MSTDTVQQNPSTTNVERGQAALATLRLHLLDALAAACGLPTAERNARLRDSLCEIHAFAEDIEGALASIKDDAEMAVTPGPRRDSLAKIAEHLNWGEAEASRSRSRVPRFVEQTFASISDELEKAVRP